MAFGGSAAMNAAMLSKIIPTTTKVWAELSWEHNGQRVIHPDRIMMKVDVAAKDGTCYLSPLGPDTWQAETDMLNALIVVWSLPVGGDTLYSVAPNNYRYVEGDSITLNGLEIRMEDG